jgi:hypothetical protein
MGKRTEDAVLDAALNQIKNNCVKLCVCTTEPATYAAATSTLKLASVVISSADFTGPANDSSGRKVTVGAQSSVSVDTTGSAAHVALVTASALYIVTTCSTQALTASNLVNVPAWEIAIADPT